MPPQLEYIAKVCNELRKMIIPDTQPCDKFEVSEVSVSGDGAQPHECPHCLRTRFFCKNCLTDHHKGGWLRCNLNTLLTNSLINLWDDMEAAHAKEKEEMIKEIREEIKKKKQDLVVKGGKIETWNEKVGFIGGIDALSDILSLPTLSIKK